MKLKSTLLCACLCCVLAFTCLGTACGGNGKIKLYVDAGGQSGNYNTSIIDNYDTLERYAGEWNKNNKNFEIVVNKYSLNGSRDSIVASLAVGEAPDILFQLPTTIAEDIANDWFVPLDEYLNKPNPYVEGNEKWSDLYMADEISSSRAPDGKLYYVGIDRIVIGIVYNADLLRGAKVTLDGTDSGAVKEPQTYSEFVAAQKKLYDTYGDGDLFYPYLPYEELYNIVLEGSIYGNFLTEYDVLDTNNIVGTEELIRAYEKGIYSFEDDIFRNGFLKAIKDKMYFKTVGYENVAPVENFLQGSVAMVEVKGDNLIRILNEPGRNFEVGFIPFPSLDSGVYPKIDGTTDSIAYQGRDIRRGSAGWGTAWWVTNSAAAKGQDAVDACVDFLMYVTSPEVNNSVVGDRGTALPLNPDDSVSVDPMLAKMLACYEQDRLDPQCLTWGVFNSAGIMNKDYYDTFITSRKTFMVKDKIGSNETDAYVWMSATLERAFERAAESLTELNGYDKSRW